MILYTKEVTKLGVLLFELLSEALGLSPNHLNDMNCAEGLVFISHYYPACPEPEATLGIVKHSDNDFLTVLLQDHVGGLQVLRDDRWFNIPPVEGALIVNIGDLLQASSPLIYYLFFSMSILKFHILSKNVIEFYFLQGKYIIYLAH